MKSISSLKDIDREILMRMDDVNFLKTCSINNYFRDQVCDDIFLQNRLRYTYPDTLQYKRNESWRQYFLDTLYYIFKLKEDYKYSYKNGNPRLQYYILKMAPPQAVKYMLQHGINITIGGINRALEVAAITGDLQVVKYLVESGANELVPPLLFAINAAGKNINDNNRLEVVKYLIEHGANINASEDYALIYSSRKGHLELVKYLIEHGAKNVKRAIHVAMDAGHDNVVEYLNRFI